MCLYMYVHVCIRVHIIQCISVCAHGSLTRTPSSLPRLTLIPPTSPPSLPATALHGIQNIYIITEGFKGDLFDFIEDNAQKLNSNIAAVIMRDVLTALAHCAQKQIVHRDIKPGTHVGRCICQYVCVCVACACAHVDTCALADKCVCICACACA